MPHLEELDGPIPPRVSFRNSHDEGTKGDCDPSFDRQKFYDTHMCDANYQSKDTDGEDENPLDLRALEDNFPAKVSHRWSAGSLSSIRSRGSTNPTSVGSYNSSRAVSPSYQSVSQGPPSLMNDQPVTLKTPEKPTCWAHGCNGREFSTLTDLRRHRREQYGKGPKITCHVCSMTFLTYGKRDRHIQRNMCKPREFATPLLRRPVSACQRCRNVNIRCDGKLPSCTACERAGRIAECSRPDDELSQGSVEPSYVASLEYRIKDPQTPIAQSLAREPTRSSEPPTARDFPDSGDSVGSERVYSLNACCKCRARRIQCDPGLPRCGPCERTNSLCEYYDMVKEKKTSRTYVVELLLQDRLQSLEKQTLHSTQEVKYPDAVPGAVPETVIRTGKDTENEVIPDSPGSPEIHSRNLESQNVSTQSFTDSPGALNAASSTTVLDRPSKGKQRGLVEVGNAATFRMPSQPTTNVLSYPPSLTRIDSEFKLFRDPIEKWKTIDNMQANIPSKFERIIASEKLPDGIWKRDNKLIGGLEEDSIRYNIFHPPQILEDCLAESLRGGQPNAKPTDEGKLPELAEEIQIQANHEKPPYRVGTNNYNPISRVDTSSMQSARTDEHESFSRVLSWGFLFKHVFPLAVLVGTYSIQLNEVKKRRIMDHSLAMNERYNIFCVSNVQIAAWMAVTYSASNLLKAKFRFLSTHFWRSEKGAIEDPSFRMSQGFRVLHGQEYTLVNSAKRYAEYLTSEPWDWWPLVPSFRPLQSDEVRLEWQCGSGHIHWSEYLREEVRLRCETSAGPSTAAMAGHRDPSNSSLSSQTSGSQSSNGRSSPATSDTGSSRPPSDNSESDDNRSSEQATAPPDKSTAVNIVPPSRLSGYVIFGVQGSKRLQSSQTRVAQIDVKVYKDDDSFFEEMRVQYQRLRGSLRWIFSIWVFHTCEFIMFYKANPNEIVPGPEEMPSVNDKDYRFDADRHPPILSSVFNGSFYGCKKACIKSRLDVMSIFHGCKGRNHCGRYRVLERLPKRRRKWAIDCDEEKDEAWGLNATFGVSFYRVALYHLLILAGPITFWGLWLRRWPADWQNASVPFFAVVVLLSLFWLPFAHNAGSKQKGKHKVA